MPVFEIETAAGKFEVTAPDENSAMDAVKREVRAIAEADALEAAKGKPGAGELYQNAFALGLLDKVAGLEGGVRGVFTGDGFAEGYRTSRRAQEIREERARENSGRAGKVAELAGTLTTGLLAKAPVAATAAGRVMQGAKEAGTLSLYQGVGDSEAEGPVGITGDALASGATGFALGGALGTALETAKGIVKAGSAATRAARNLTGGDKEKAARKVYQALIDDGMSPEQAAARMRSRDTALINTADENTLGLARAASAKPGEGRSTLNRALDKQQKNSGARIVSAVDDALGGKDVPFNKRVADMVKTRSNLGRQQYEKAFAGNFGAEHAMVFDDIAGRLPAEAVRNAQRIAQAEGRPFGEQLIASIDEAAGVVTFKRAPSLREWHYIQRGLRSASDSAYRQGVGEVGTAYKSLRGELIDAMDEASPLYKKARAAYSSASDMIDAIQRGREIMNPATTRNVDALIDEIGAMSKSERDMVKIGLARQLQDMVESTPDQAGDMVRKIFGTEAKRKAIRSVFDSASDFRKFEAELGRIAKETNSFRYVRTGSRTSFVDAEKQDAGILADAATGAMDMASGGVASTTVRAASKLLRDMGGMDEGVAKEVAAILIQRDPDAVLSALAQSGTQAQKKAARQALMLKAQPYVKALIASQGGEFGSDVGRGIVTMQ